MDIFLDALWDATKDTLIVIPILYLAYLLVSYFSHNNNEKYAKVLHYTNKAGPVIGAFLGCIPQCGFSSVMSQLYSKKIITLGTLMAVFIATSDEAIPIMISDPEFIPDLLILLAIKVIYGIIVGYIIDGIIKLFNKRNKVLQSKTEQVNEQSNKPEEKTIELSVPSDISTSTVATENHSEENSEEQKVEEHIHDTELSQEQNNNTIDKELEQIDFSGCECGHSHKHKKHKCHHGSEEEHGHDHSHSHCCATNIFLDALKHTAIIVAYVFAATLIINLINGYCGGLEPLQTVFTDNVYIQVLFAALIGLIPNCAASVFIVELFMSGVLYFPALVAGLSAGAGVGLIVLYTSNYKKMGVNIIITVMLYCLAVIGGIIINFIPIL